MKKHKSSQAAWQARMREQGRCPKCGDEVKQEPRLSRRIPNEVLKTAFVCCTKCRRRRTRKYKEQKWT